MCNACPNLDDDLSDLLGDSRALPVANLVTFAKEQLPERFKTTCRKCNGSGRFVGYTGRVLGNCFTCKGAGFHYTKTDPTVLEANRQKAADKKARDARHNAEQAAAWLLGNPAEGKWLVEAAGRGFEFAVSLHEALIRYGHLTEKQEAAVRNATAKSLERQAQWQAEKTAREASKASVSIERIAQAFTTARESKLKWPKLRLDTFTFSLASETGRNAGAIYVKDGETYLGKIEGDKFTRSRDCDAETEARIVAVCADPAAAATAYGQRTGQCSCCGRELTNAESIARAIGPICAEKWGL
jgi:hypothetical protein